MGPELQARAVEQNSGIGPLKRSVFKMRGVAKSTKLRYCYPLCSTKLLFHGAIWGPLSCKDAEKLKT
eukprot:2316375-Pyramimonas_sp.AAC.1